MNTHAAPADAPAPIPAPAAARVSSLTGDRFCTGCGFNLAGQAVLREPHYGMLMVRCPECAAVASLQEYPLLGRWPTRLRALMAAVWVLFMAVLLLATVGILLAHVDVARQTGVRQFSRGLIAANLEWARQQPEPFRSSWTGPLENSYAGDYTPLTPVWVASADLRAVALSATGNAGGFRWRTGASVAALLAWWLFIPGVVWSVAMPHVRRRGMLVAALVPGGAAAAFVAAQAASGAVPAAMPVPFAGNVAADFVGSGVGFVLLGFSLLALVCGMWAGRPLCRWLVRLLLPPSLRGPLSVLWTADGLPPPSTR